MKEGVWTLASCSKDSNFETIHILMVFAVCHAYLLLFVT